jgi:hypothetical protein
MPRKSGWPSWARPGYWAGAMAVAMMLAVGVVSGPAAAATPTVVPQYENTSGPSVYLTIASAVGLTKFTSEHTEAQPWCTILGGRRVDLPDVAGSVAAGGEAQSCFEVSLKPAILTVTYRIAGTTDLLWIYVDVPWSGTNTVKCDVISEKTRKTNPDSAYTCSTSWQQSGHRPNNNPMPKIVLKRKPTVTVTDGAEATRYIGQNCDAGQSRCSYDAAKKTVEALPQSKWVILGSLRNCNNPDESDRDVWSETKEFGTEFTIGGSAKATFKIPKVVEIEAEAHAENTWTKTFTYSHRLEAPVKYGTVHYFYAQPGVLRIQGKFVITLGDKIVVIPDADYQFPLGSDYDPGIGVGEKISPVTIHSLSAPTSCSTAAPQNAKPNIKDMTETPMTVG